MSSPTQSASGGPKPVAPSPSGPTNPITPVKATVLSSDSTSPMECVWESTFHKGPECNHTTMRRVYRESTYFEDNCSANPEEDEKKYTEKLELIKKQIQIKKMISDRKTLSVQIEDLKESVEPIRLHLDRLDKQLATMAAAHYSREKLIDDILDSSDVLNKTGSMSAAEILEARKARAKVTKLQLERMESEIEVLELQLLVDSERAIFDAKAAELRAAPDTLKEMTSSIIDLKHDYEKSSAAWIAKYSVEEGTHGTVDDGTLNNLEKASGEKVALQLNITELSNNFATLKLNSANDTRLLKEQVKELTDAAAFAKVIAAEETHLLKEQVRVLTEDAAFSKVRARPDDFNEKLKAQAQEIECLKATMGMDIKLSNKVKELEGKIEIMMPIYRLGRLVRYRSNYSALRKKYQGQNVTVNYDKYEDGYAAYFAGHAVADSTMYHAGFDEDDINGRDKNNFESLHYGVPAKIVWKLRNEFTILPKILDMASNMKVYISKQDKSDDEFGTVEFKKIFEKAFTSILPMYGSNGTNALPVLAITSDEQFRKNVELVKAFSEMASLVQKAASKNWWSRRQGVEESWEQPYENAWMDFADDLYEASRRGMC